MSASSWAELLDELRRDNSSGATFLTRRAAAGLPLLAEAAEREPGSAELRIGLRALATVRPPFGALFKLANLAAAALDCPDAAVGASVVLKAVAVRFAADLERQHAALVAESVALIEERSAVLTISASSVVRDVLLAARRRGARPQVTCLESRPGLEGAALAAELAQAGLHVRLAADAAAGRLAGESTLVLVGGDTLSPTGLVHKLGTLSLAQAAAAQGVPVYGLLGSLKMLPRPVSGWQLDGGDAHELSPEARSGVDIWNRYYDLTPLTLLTAVVTEQGAVNPRTALSTLPAPHPWLADLLEPSPAANQPDPAKINR